MIHDEFEKGIAVLQAAFRRRYSDQSITLFWEELREVDGNAFNLACRTMARSGERLPSLSEIFRNLPVQEEKTDNGELAPDAPWLDQVRKIYNDCTALATYEERLSFAEKLDSPKRTLLFHGKILYEKIWPQVIAEHPDWSKDSQVRECLRRFVPELQRYFNPPKHQPAETR